MAQSIVIQVGQCGNQIGYRFWDLALKEHEAYCEFQAGDDYSFFRFSEKQGSSEDTFYNGKARALLVDMEESVISEIMRSPMRNFFDSKQLLMDVSGSGNNWAFGHFVYGITHKESIKELLRREAEECDNLQCFLFLHSLGGGTGSGLGTSILEMVHDEYPKVHRFVNGVYPSSCDDVVTSPYNALLANDQLIEFADCVFPVENKALGDACEYIEKNIFFTRNAFSKKINSPSNPNYSFIPEKPFDCMNDIIANLLINITCSSRFPGSMNVDLNELIMNMVPFPRLHFITSSITPLIMKTCISSHRFQNLFSELLSNEHNLFEGELKTGQFLSAAFLLRGHINLSDVQKQIDSLRQDFVLAPWNDDGWKTGLCSISPIDHPYSAVLLSNNSCMGHAFANLKTRFLKMYNKKAHLHHFLQVSEMHKDIFDSSLHNLNSVIEEYQSYGQLKPADLEIPRLEVVA